MDDKQQERMKKARELFQIEATEHIQLINRALLDIERGVEGEVYRNHLEEANRSAHNIKGAARMVGLSHIEMLSHTVESILIAGMANTITLNANVCDLLYDALDLIEKLLIDENLDIEELQTKLLTLLEDDSEQVKTEATARLSPPEDVSQQIIFTPTDNTTIRVDLNKLDALIAQIGELQVSKMNADLHVTDLRETLRLMEHFTRGWDEFYTLIAHTIQQNAQNYLHVMLENQSSQIQLLLHKMQHLAQSASSDTLHLGMVTDGLRDRVRSIRMLPFESISLGFERAVRDVAHAENKVVSFDIIGAEVELDKSVLEILKDPLMHLLNNAVSHGIEPSTERIALGKSESGRVQIRIQQHGNEASIIVSDDGNGFDLEALQTDASYNGLDEFSDENSTIQHAFKPGVSTASELSTISGRGIGLDVVRTKLESIQGRIQVSSTPQQGTNIELIVPTSLAITRSLLIQVNEQQFALPIAAIERIVEVKNVVTVNDSQMLNVDGQHIPLVSLMDILEMPANDASEGNQHALVLSTGDQRIAVVVTDALTEQELSVKPLGSLLSKVRHVIGVAMLGTGLPIVVLSPSDILRSASKHKYQNISFKNISNSDEVEIQTSIHILVVDDSITTRTLEQNILESAGYEVTTAINGIEALEQLSHNNFDLVISDIQMPLMDGFQLVSSIRQSVEFRDLPVILVTSLMSREDKERGLKVGADAYIIKQNFSQDEFVSIIERFIEK